ncbi:hypothetical protein SF83666_c22700 [Sinorhizobium fredii CCBAU 83666]|nr:hypothetical protein SF83666_c22700 [Sinorhizobium fredii CCBAU 83666]
MLRGSWFHVQHLRYQSSLTRDQYKIGLAIGVNIDQIGCDYNLRDHERAVPRKLDRACAYRTSAPDARRGRVQVQPKVQHSLSQRLPDRRLANRL